MRHSYVRCDDLQRHPGISPGDTRELNKVVSMVVILQRYPGNSPGDMSHTGSGAPVMRDLQRYPGISPGDIFPRRSAPSSTTCAFNVTPAIHRGIYREFPGRADYAGAPSTLPRQFTGGYAPSFSIVESWPSDLDGERFRRSFPGTVEPDAPSLPGSSQLSVMQWNSDERAVPGCLAPPQRSQGRSSPRPTPTPAPRKSGPRTRS